MDQTSFCSRCHRLIIFPITSHQGPCDTGVSAYVVHEYYGCDSDCCGHHAYLVDTRGEVVASDFTFAHPWPASMEQFIHHVLQNRWPWATIDYAKCQVSDDP